MVAFIDRHRDQYGVEAICALLPMAPSSYYEYKARQIDASRLPARTHRERQLEGEIHRVWQPDFNDRYAHLRRTTGRGRSRYWVNFASRPLKRHSSSRKA